MAQAASTPRTVQDPDSGTYGILLSVEGTHRLAVGSLGALRFPPGTYVYTGGAARGLASAVDRLVRAEGSGQRHVDRLDPLAAERAAETFPGEPVPCELATHIARLPGALPVLGFGSTGCSCLTHLYGFLDQDLDEVRKGLRSWSPAP